LENAPAWSVVVLSLFAAEEESPSHPMRAQAAITINVSAFISDSVEVSGETPAESVVAH
jgi:hypothetical protein